MNSLGITDLNIPLGLSIRVSFHISIRDFLSFLSVFTESDSGAEANMPTTAAAVAATGMGLGFMSLFLILWVVIIAIAILGFALWIWALIDSLNRKYHRDDSRLLWTLIIVFAGWIGAIVYYFCVVRNPKNW